MVTNNGQTLSVFDVTKDQLVPFRLDSCTVVVSKTATVNGAGAPSQLIAARKRRRAQRRTGTDRSSVCDDDFEYRSPNFVQRAVKTEV